MKRIKRAALAALAVCSLAAVAPQPASADGQEAQGWLSNYCHKKWLAHVYGGIGAFWNGNGYGRVSWWGQTNVKERRYWDHEAIRNYPDRSCTYSNSFNQLNATVHQNGNRYAEAPFGVVGSDNASWGGYREYPLEHTSWEWHGTHTFASDERQMCELWYTIKTEGHAHVGHYTPHPPHRAMDDGTWVETIDATAPLFAELQNDVTTISLPDPTATDVHGVLPGLDVEGGGGGPTDVHGVLPGLET